jgi:hypothetical protein
MMRFTLEMRLNCSSQTFTNFCSKQFRLKLTLDGSGIILEKVAEYFYYNYKNRDEENVPDMEIPPELCLELLMAADYLDSKYSEPHCCIWLIRVAA